MVASLLISLLTSMLGSAIGSLLVYWAFYRNRVKFEAEMRMVHLFEAARNERKIARIERQLGLDPLFPAIFDQERGAS